MLLTDLHTAQGSGNTSQAFICDDVFTEEKNADTSITIDLNGAIVYPGFINSHDHLDFNLFPLIGNKVYNNYREWGDDIHKNNRHLIQSILQIPEAVRVRWGMYKNLLSGFTTVVNHGARLTIPDPFIHVFQDTCSLHSAGFEKNWRWKLNSPFSRKTPVAIHCGEGTDNLANEEIETLLNWNLLSKKIVGIHGVAMMGAQARRFRALVWCPASNHFLLEKTADINELKNYTTILFGSDSTLTSDWNIWKHFSGLSPLQNMTKQELLRAITTNAANSWGMKNRGSIQPGKMADAVVVKNDPGSKTIINDPEDILMVIQQGRIRYFDECLYDQLASQIDLVHFSNIRIGNSNKFIYGNIPRLIEITKQYNKEISLPICVQPTSSRPEVNNSHFVNSQSANH